MNRDRSLKKRKINLRVSDPVVKLHDYVLGELWKLKRFQSVDAKVP